MSASVTNAWRRRLLQAQRKQAALAFARLDRDRGVAGVGGERVAGGVARAAVADLGEQLGGGDHAVGVPEQREEDGAVGVLADGGRDLPLELLDLLVERLDHRDQRPHEFSAGAELELADPGHGGAAELGQKLRGGLAAGVTLAGEERRAGRCWPSPRASAGLG